MANYKKWTNTETDFINNNHKIMNDETLAKELSQMVGQSVTTAMIRRQRRKLNLKKERGRPRKNSTIQINSQGG
jgi:hypothetical protein